MAAGEDDKAKDAGGDPIERAMRKRAEAEAKAAAAKPSVVGSAMEKAAASLSGSASRSAAPPSASETPSRPYEPSEGSFFAPSADERAEQARRAAQRVRRRAKGEPEPMYEPAYEPTATPEPVTPPAPVAPPPPVPRAPSVAAPPPIAPTAPPVQRPAAPVAKTPPAKPAKPAKPKKSAHGRYVPEPAPAPVPPKTEAPDFDGIARAAEASKPKPAPETKPAPPTEKATFDMIARSAEAARTKSAPTPNPSAKIEPTIAPPKPAAPKSDPASLISRASIPAAAAKTTATVTASPASRPAKARPAKPVRTARVQAPATPKQAPPQQTAPAKAPPAASAAKLKSPPAQPAPDSIETIYAETPETPLEHTSFQPLPAIRNARTKAFAAFEWMIASRYLRARKKEGFVSVIAGFSLVGIALGVATLIVVMAVMTGFRETLISQIIGGSPHINVQAQTERFETFDTIAQNIRGVPGVTYVTPVVQGQVLGTGRRGHSGVLVRGMRKGDLQNLIESANPEVTNGSLTDFVEDKGVAVGANLAAKLGLRVGDFITLISPDGDITPFSATPTPRKKDYKIIYTFKLGVQEIDYNVVFMTFSEAQIYFNKQGVADTLDVFVENPNEVEQYSNPIFGSARSSISLYNWKTQNGRLIGAINLERQVMFVILTMIILVAALNIISGLVMLVKDKSRDVAIMRTMGMARGSILRIFFICGSSIGVVGSFAGVIIGCLFVWNIKSVQSFVEWATGTTVWDPAMRAGMTEIPTKLQFGDVSLTLFIALGLSFLATLYPAWKAAKLDPVEALRYE